MPSVSLHGFIFGFACFFFKMFFFFFGLPVVKFIGNTTLSLDRVCRYPLGDAVQAHVLVFGIDRDNHLARLR